MTIPLRSCQKRWFIIQNDGLVLGKITNETPSNDELARLEPTYLRQFKLGLFNNTEHFCAEIDSDVSIPDSLHVLPLRNALSLFNKEGYGLIVKAYSIIQWDKNHQFCSRCGSVTFPQAKVFERRCSSCGLAFYPRISPSIIVLIKKKDHLLMARSPHFPAGVYGLIAGFVDVGESAEEAVKREVLEEVGLRIKNLTYVDSQAWPFPDSLMMAFTADYASGEIVIQRDEIEAAGWYKYDNLPGLPSVAISIGSKLINDFVNLFK